MDTKNVFRIEEKALDVLDDFGAVEPVIDAVAIAAKYEVSVKEIEMPKGYTNVAGFYNEDKKTIFVAKDDKPSRKLFTVAHELGHIFLGHKNYDVLFRIPKEGTYTQEEKEANLFAAKLLMPDFLLEKYLKKYHLSKSDYKIMSDIFGVPIVAMKHQLNHL